MKREILFLALVLMFCMIGNVCFAEERDDYCITSSADGMPEGVYDTVVIGSNVSDTVLRIENVTANKLICYGGKAVSIGKGSSIGEIVVDSDCPYMYLDVLGTANVDTLVVNKIGQELYLTGYVKNCMVPADNALVAAEHDRVDTVVITGTNSTLVVGPTEHVVNVAMNSSVSASHLIVRGIVGTVSDENYNSTITIEQGGSIKKVYVGANADDTVIDAQGTCGELYVDDNAEWVELFLSAAASVGNILAPSSFIVTDQPGNTIGNIAITP